jgi:hypothetical protein
MRSVRAMSATLLLVALVASVTRTATAQPPPPPGGHHPVYYGGANSAGYPQVPVVSVGDPKPKLGPLRVTVSPNPFRTRATLRFLAHGAELARVRLYGPSGRVVRELTRTASRTGFQELIWDGRDQRGVLLPSGIYFFSVRVGTQTATGRLAIVR